MDNHLLRQTQHFEYCPVSGFDSMQDFDTVAPGRLPYLRRHLEGVRRLRQKKELAEVTSVLSGPWKEGSCIVMVLGPSIQAGDILCIAHRFVDAHVGCIVYVDDKMLTVMDTSLCPKGCCIQGAGGVFIDGVNL